MSVVSERSYAVNENRADLETQTRNPNLKPETSNPKPELFQKSRFLFTETLFALNLHGTRGICRSPNKDPPRAGSKSVSIHKRFVRLHLCISLDTPSQTMRQGRASGAASRKTP